MKKKIEIRAFVRDIRIGLSHCEMMAKYGVSAGELCSLFLQMYHLGHISASELHALDSETSDLIHLEDSRATTRCYVNSGISIYEPRRNTQGVVLDISERGFQVGGLEAKERETKDLVIVADWSPPYEVHVLAQCRWTDPAAVRDERRAGFEIVEVTAGSVKRLCEGLSSPASTSFLRRPTLHGETALDHEMSRGLALLGTGTDSLALPDEAGLSRDESAFSNVLMVEGTARAYTNSTSERIGGKGGRFKGTGASNIISLKDSSRGVSGQRGPVRIGSAGFFAVSNIDTANCPIEWSGSNWEKWELDSKSLVMRDVLEKCKMAARSDGIILLCGETGSGKDYLAEYIHCHSGRAAAPFRSLNCSAIPSDLAESELFGHEAGAFTGASSRKKGLLSSTPGGTLLLNEVGELPLALQAKLLTFLDTKCFVPVGGHIETAVDARILAATNRNLHEEVSKGRFRQDLFYRLNVLPISVPALRERIDDLPLLIPKLLARVSRELGMNCTYAVDKKTLALLQGYSWPGNIRELRNRIERSLVLSGGKKISFSLMFDEYSNDKWSLNMEFDSRQNFNDFIQETRRRLVLEALKRSRGNRQVAAKLLGITRYSLKRHMTTLGLMCD